MTVVDADDVQRFYEDFYRYLNYFLFPHASLDDKLIRVSGSFITPALIRSKQIVNFFSMNSSRPMIEKN